MWAPYKHCFALHYWSLLNTAYTMGLSGLPRYKKHELCKFCRSQRVNECFIFRGKRQRKATVRIFITRTYSKPSYSGLSMWHDYKTFSLPWQPFHAAQLNAHDKELVFTISCIYGSWLWLTQAKKTQRTHLGSSVYRKRRSANFNELFCTVYP